MMDKITRKDFLKTTTLSMGTTAIPGQWFRALFAKRFNIGHTAITWGYGPANTEQAIDDIAQVSFYSLECFGGALEYWEERGGIGRLLEDTGVELRGVYCPVNLLDPQKCKEQLAAMLNRGQLLKKYGGSVAVIGPDMVDRAKYDFAEHKTNITATLDELAGALADIGVTAVLHQHKNSCIETREELYPVMDVVDTNYVKLCPDLGHLYNGGMDPLQVVKDFLPVIGHMHIKDYEGGEGYNGFCPLGKGVIEIAKVLEVLEQSGQTPSLMAELNPPPKDAAQTPLELIEINKEYLVELGYRFNA